MGENFDFLKHNRRDCHFIKRWVQIVTQPNINNNKEIILAKLITTRFKTRLLVIMLLSPSSFLPFRGSDDHKKKHKLSLSLFKSLLSFHLNSFSFVFLSLNQKWLTEFIHLENKTQTAQTPLFPLQSLNYTAPPVQPTAPLRAATVIAVPVAVPVVSGQLLPSSSSSSSSPSLALSFTFFTALTALLSQSPPLKSQP